MQDIRCKSGVRVIEGGGASALDDPDALLERFRPTIEEFTKTPHTKKQFDALSQTPEYGALMSELRVAAVMNAANPKAEAPRVMLEKAAAALNMPLADLQVLAKVPADAVAQGRWRPMLINAELVDPDEFAGNGETQFQQVLDKITKKILPKTRQFYLPGYATLMQGVGLAAEVTDPVGRVATMPLDATQKMVAGWSDQTATDVQKSLREIRTAISSTGLSRGALKKMHEDEQRAVLLATKVMTGMTVDAEKFVEWARTPEMDKPKDLNAALEKWTSSGLFGLSEALGGIAGAIRGVTGKKGWRKFAVHATVGQGFEKAYFTFMRWGLTFMLPNLDQIDHNGGKAIVRAYLRITPADSMWGGLTLTPRGAMLKFRGGPVGARVSDFQHEIKFGIPGVVGANIVEDYAYGPSLSFGWSPVINKYIGADGLPVNIRAGGKVQVFHPSPVAVGFVSGAMVAPLMIATGLVSAAVGWLVVPAAMGAAVGLLFPHTRPLAKGIACTLDAIWRGAGKLAYKAGFDMKEPKTVEDGWPVGARWAFARRAADRAEAASFIAHRRLDRLKEIDPQKLVEVVGEQRAAVLGDAAKNPAEVHATMVKYLETLVKEVDDETRSLEAAAEEATTEQVSKPDQEHAFARVKNKAEEAIKRAKTLKRLTSSLERHAIGYEYVDVLLRTLVPDPSDAITVELQLIPGGDEPPADATQSEQELPKAG